MSILQWPNALRAKGLSVYVRPGWETNRPIGNLIEPLAGVFWHHDATPKGETPGGWEWIKSAYDAGNPSAQIWLDYRGQWRFAGSGKAHHAGVVRGSLDSSNCPGVEWDHTINEPIPPELLRSIQIGFAAICEVEKQDASFMTMHKIEAFPRGRKQDPWLSELSNNPQNWDQELIGQRAVIRQIMQGNIKPPAPIVKEDDAMFTLVKVKGTGPVYIMGPGVFYHINPSELNSLRKSRLLVDAGAIHEYATVAELQLTRKIMLGSFKQEIEASPVVPAKVFHTVEPGDTLTKIAAKYKVSVASIVALNKLSNPDNISVGQRLLVKG